MTDYDPFAAAFIEARSPTVGVTRVLAWARGLPTGGRVLDLGCAHGVPIARALADAGFRVHGVDTSPRLLEAFRENVPEATAELGNAATLEMPRSGFDGAVAWGLVFLLDPHVQEEVIHRAGGALVPGGRLLMTAPYQVADWVDVLTGARCTSLGAARYRAILAAAGLALTGEDEDEGGNHYWFAVKTPPPPSP